MARRLRKGGIVRLSQLAAASPAHLAALIPGLSAERVVRLRWIEQARNLSSAPPVSTRRKGGALLQGRQRYSTFTVELLADEDNQVRRTRVTHIQSGGQEAWAGWDERRLLGLLRRRSGLPIPGLAPAPRVEDAAGPPAAPSPPPAPLGGEFRLSRLETLSAETGETRPILAIGEPFVVRVTADLANVEAPPGAPLDCRLTVRAKSVGGARRLVAETCDSLRAGGQEDLQITTAIHWPPGLYRLDAVAALVSRGSPEPPTLVAAFQGHLVQVC
jgi:hypothetical protein